MRGGEWGVGIGEWARISDDGRAMPSLLTPRSSPLNKDVLASPLHDDLFGVLEPSNDVHDPLLGLFDLAQADGSSDLHLFAQRLRRASRLIARSEEHTSELQSR